MGATTRPWPGVERTAICTQSGLLQPRFKLLNHKLPRKVVRRTFAACHKSREPLRRALKRAEALLKSQLRPRKGPPSPAWQAFVQRWHEGNFESCKGVGCGLRLGSARPKFSKASTGCIPNFLCQ